MHSLHFQAPTGTPRARKTRGLRLHVAERRDAARTLGLRRGAGNGAHGGTPGGSAGGIPGKDTIRTMEKPHFEWLNQ